MTEIKKINQKITQWTIKKDANPLENEEKRLTKEEWELEQKNNRFSIYNTPRESSLRGTTFKIKPSNEKHSLFITVNEQKIDEIIYPREIFFSTKNTSHKMWMDSLSFLISAIFRRGGDVSFLVDELSNVYDSSGGYWGRNKTTNKGKFYFSIVHEIGDVIDVYLQSIYKLNGEHKNAEINEIQEQIQSDQDEAVYPKNAEICGECGEKALVLMDGCKTCLACGNSKCS